MSTRKRNEWLEDDLSEEEGGSGYDSEAAEASKTKGRSVKKRKIEDDASESDDAEDEEDKTVPVEKGETLGINDEVNEEA